MLHLICIGILALIAIVFIAHGIIEIIINIRKFIKTGDKVIKIILLVSMIAMIATVIVGYFVG